VNSRLTTTIHQRNIGYLLSAGNYTCAAKLAIVWTLCWILSSYELVSAAPDKY